jgi:hemolysin activation/secretion protein
MTRGIKDAQFSYVVPLFSPRVALNIRGSFNNAAVVASALAPLDIHAKDRSGEVGLTYYLRQAPMMVRGAKQRWSASETLSAGVSVLNRRQRSYLLGQPFSFAPGSVNGRAEYDAARLAGDYVRRDLNRVIAISLGATIGFDGTRSDVVGIPNPRKRFASLLGQFNVAQRLGRDFELRGRVTGQYSHGTLYSGLRLSAGGINSVRGYRESLFVIDRGIIGSVELARDFKLAGDRTPTTFDWGAFTGSIFADGAAFKNAQAPHPGETSVSSIGASLAWTPSSALRAGITYGRALKDVATANGESLQDRGIHFRVLVHPLGLF